MNDYVAQHFVEMHQADLRHEAERERLIREAKGARRGEHGDFLSFIRGALGLRGSGLRPAMNAGH